MNKPEKLKHLAAASQDAPTYLTADERAAQGRALRDTVPRGAQSGWTPPANRRDPVDLLNESNAGRILDLVPIRFGRMAASPFAFYRGSASLMAADLATTATSGIRVQACGDAHLMNFGGFATPERNIIFDINDLDETLPAPFEWDLKRLAASVAIAAEHLAFPKSDAARVDCWIHGSGQTFDDAICEFATEYCSQNRGDYRAFLAAIREGRIEARMEQG